MCGFSSTYDQRAIGWIEVQPDDLGRLGGERGIFADAPRFAPGKVDLVGAQEAPDILLVHVSQGAGDQRPRPAPMAGRRRAIEHGENAPVRLGSVGRRGASLASLIKPGQALCRIAHPPLARRADRAANATGDRPRCQAVSRQQHDPCSLPHAMLALARTRQTLQFGTLIFRQYDRSRFKNTAHAALNRDSSFSDSGY